MRKLVGLTLLVVVVLMLLPLTGQSHPTDVVHCHTYTDAQGNDVADHGALGVVTPYGQVWSHGTLGEVPAVTTTAPAANHHGGDEQACG